MQKCFENYICLVDYCSCFCGNGVLVPERGVGCGENSHIRSTGVFKILFCCVTFLPLTGTNSYYTYHKLTDIDFSWGSLPYTIPKELLLWTVWEAEHASRNTGHDTWLSQCLSPITVCSSCYWNRDTLRFDLQRRFQCLPILPDNQKLRYCKSCKHKFHSLSLSDSDITFLTWSWNFKANKFKSSIGWQGLNIAEYGKA